MTNLSALIIGYLVELEIPKYLREIFSQDGLLLPSSVIRIYNLGINSHGVWIVFELYLLSHVMTIPILNQVWHFLY